MLFRSVSQSRYSVVNYPMGFVLNGFVFALLFLPVMHAETLYYNSIANADYIVGAPVHIQGIYVFVGISLDDAAIGEPMRVAYAGKCKVFVESGLDVTEGDYAIYNTITNKIAIGLGNEISNRVGIRRLLCLVRLLSLLGLLLLLFLFPIFVFLLL